MACAGRPRRPAGALVLAVGLLAGPAAAGPAHQHGAGHLGLAVDGPVLSLVLSLPLDTVLGFERAPRNAAERQRAEAARSRLREAAALYALDAEAGCQAVAAELDAPVLDGAPAGPDGHAELEVRHRFECRRIEALRRLELRAFAAFPRLERLTVQAALPGGQRRAVLSRAAPGFTLKP